MRIKKEMRINIDFINFISKLIKEKVVVDEKMRGSILKDYEKEVELRFSNLKRVSNRNKREEVKEILKGELKSRNIEVKEYIEVSEKLENLVNKKNNNYVSIKV